MSGKDKVMIIRALMTRTLPKLDGGQEAEILPRLSSLLFDLRSMALRQPGYISGETMRNVEDPSEFLVISTWRSIEDWQDWFENEKREILEGKVDEILGTQTQYKIYSY
jgi:heme-degrading monooxygenase HmoA